MNAVQIVVEDLTGPQIARFLAEHVSEMLSVTPPESKHALDLEALRGPGITFWSVMDGGTVVGCGALVREPPAELPQRGAGAAVRLRVLLEPHQRPPSGDRRDQRGADRRHDAPDRPVDHQAQGTGQAGYKGHHQQERRAIAQLLAGAVVFTGALLIVVPLIFNAVFLVERGRLTDGFVGSHARSLARMSFTSARSRSFRVSPV